MRALFMFCLVLIAQSLFAQLTLQGKVIDSATGQPLANVSVFISNTSAGTTTKQDGSFSLSIPQGTYQIVFSYIGYTTKTFTTNTISNSFHIGLSPAENRLADVVLMPFEKDGWARWGKFFTDLFIGTTDEALQCIIQNTKTIRFRQDKKNKTLQAVAFEPLIITNKALGYKIQYQLEEFTYDFNNKYLFYQGYPLFMEMQGSRHKQKHWQEKRREVYEGSQMHFMRSLYRNTLMQEGFDVFRMLKTENEEKKRIKQALRYGPIPKDSSAYYENILAEPDEKSIIYSGRLTGDSIAFGINDITAGFQFDNYLYINYNKKKVPDAFLRSFPKSTANMASEITLLEKVILQVEANGNFHPQLALLNTGYWGWSEKISRILPFDYTYGR
ncbi:carboxypeptidase-like regulatory domain-containing protein [Parafilimonas sp.]|uniref:carboxypeptidase-like regulatory domain-containing protein n=1 Tax=Parafilimonas sp. TaxID=1969739 RepID=UPI0039E69F3B